MWRVAGLLTLAVAVVSAPADAATRARAVGNRTSSGAATTALDGAAALTLVGTQQLDARLSDLTFKTPALSGPTHVRVLVPSGYSASSKRYPVLYLLHGCCDNYLSWTTEGDAEAITAGLPVIVVMPDGGEGGFYSDWYNSGAGGPPMWETYHIDELIPWIDAHFRTIASRGGRAIAGLSMGGFGAMSYAARHPDLFAAAASFSGAVDNMDPYFGMADYAFPVLDQGLPDSIWGPQPTQEIRWRGHNPVDLANNLRGLNLTIRTGNGLPGGPYGGGPDALEAGVHHESVSFEQTLTGLGIPSTFQDYGPGSHSWPYWQRDLRLTLPTLMAVFAHPPAPPARITYTSIEPSYEAYGWKVSMHRPALEFSTLRNADARAFTLTGSGTGTVTTPSDYTPGRRYRVTEANASGAVSSTLRADGTGRLTILAALGAGNADQEDTPQAEVGGTAVEHASVTIAGVTPSAKHPTAAPRCTRARRVVIRLPRRATASARRIVLEVNGRRITRVDTVAGGHAVSVDLHGLRRTVHVTLLVHGRRATIRIRRVYHLCTRAP